MTVNTPVIQSIIQGLLNSREPKDSVALEGGLQLQVLPRMTDLPRCQKHQYAAFVLDPPLLVVWDDDANRIFSRPESIEKMIISMIWKTDDGEEEDEPKNEKAVDINIQELSPAALEEALKAEVRPSRITSSMVVALALALSITCLGLGYRALALQITVDNSYTRLALLAVGPVTLFISLFFFMSISGNVFQVFGPISGVNQNSKNFSGKPPRRMSPHSGELPHVTIQMPVYKEGLNAVIKPTVISLKAAISTYEMQGGTANILVNDDGMQLIDEEEAQARRDFYEEHNMGWVSRPGHNPNPENPGEAPFLRKGRFKKASNMNYALMTSIKVEEKLMEIERGNKWGQESEDQVYAEALTQVLEESEGRTWADGNIRIGDYILLIDSDTRVPRDCLLDAVSEMDASPEVAIIQYTSGVMNVSDSFFEQAVTWFTEMIYTSITFAVANGDISPFVGHNAVLRWSALQDAASYFDEEDGYEKFWSESHVSEDFDMALRLQTAGYSIRYGAYTGDGFKEGVSLTVYDELARWEKYAYGCNELLFHPLRFWIIRGPFTPLFKKFIFSNIAFPRKMTILAYIGTYYAIGASWPLTVLNYFVTGWYWGHYDKYYLDSFATYVSIIVVFPLVGNLSLAILRYRLGERSLLSACKFFRFSPYLLSHTNHIFSVGKLQVDAHFHDLPWRYLSPRLQGTALSFLRDRHSMGCDIEGGGELQLSRGDSENHQEFCGYLRVLLWRHGTDHMRLLRFPTGVADQNLCDHLPVVRHHLFALRFAGPPQPSADEVHFLKPLILLHDEFISMKMGFIDGVTLAVISVG